MYYTLISLPSLLYAVETMSSSQPLTDVPMMQRDLLRHVVVAVAADTLDWPEESRRGQLEGSMRMLREADTLIDNERGDIVAEGGHLGRGLHRKAACCLGIHRMLAQALQTTYGCGFVECSAHKYLAHRHSVGNRVRRVESHTVGEGYMD